MFEVDKEGLAKLLERRGKRFAVLELIQNSLDEKGVEGVYVTLQPSMNHRGHYVLKVEDDAPDGFHDLSHAYTLFAESKKKGNPEQRGRWNLGEKLVIAVCHWAQIKTTTGTVTFADGQRKQSKEHRRVGSLFTGVMRMTHAEAQEAIVAARSVLVPPGFDLRINGEAVDCRQPIKSCEPTLQTEISDDEGVLRRTKRKTSLAVYPVAMGEEPHLYEMGIPVVPIDCEWHVDIAQKIPLNFDRDNVTPAYARAVLTAVVNLMHESLSSEVAAKPWVGEALASPDITPVAVRAIMTAKHGENAVAYDPSDQEGTKIAVTRGFEVVHGRSYTKEQWENIRASGAVLPAGQVTPSPKPFHPDGAPLKTLPRSDWNDCQVDFEDYVHRVSGALIGREVELVLANDRSWGFSAAYGHGRLTVSIIGKSRWFESRPMNAECLAEIDRLLIHELAHDKVSDHLSEAFHEECCKLGARLAQTIRSGKV